MSVLKRYKYRIKRAKKRLLSGNKNIDKGQEKGKKNRYGITRQDVIFLPIGDYAELEIYWKLTKKGNGPAVILHILGKQVIRFDCFGEPNGHGHIYLIAPDKNCERRLNLPEKTVEAQIDRALFELSENANYWIPRHRNPAVRKIRLNSQKLSDAIAQARSTMLDYHQRSLQVLASQVSVVSASAVREHSSKNSV